MGNFRNQVSSAFFSWSRYQTNLTLIFIVHGWRSAEDESLGLLPNSDATPPRRTLAAWNIEVPHACTCGTGGGSTLLVHVTTETGAVQTGLCDKKVATRQARESGNRPIQLLVF